MHTDMFDLTGKNAIVTGSTQGIGRGMAEGLMAAGARVIINGRTQEKCDGLVQECRDQGFSADAVAFDVADPESVQAGIDQARSLVGDIHILINNAGGAARGPFDQMTFEQWKHVMDLNVDSVFHVTKAVIPEMIERRAGKIINTCSLMSLIARRDNANYAASKGAVGMLTKELAVEYAAHNIQVNGIVPGFIATPLTRVLADDATFDKWLKGRTPMARWGRPAELAGAAVFLASDASGFVTGHLLNVDGGLTAAI